MPEMMNFRIVTTISRMIEFSVLDTLKARKMQDAEPKAEKSMILRASNMSRTSVEKIDELFG